MRLPVAMAKRPIIVSSVIAGRPFGGTGCRQPSFSSVRRQSRNSRIVDPRIAQKTPTSLSAVVKSRTSSSASALAMGSQTCRPTMSASGGSAARIALTMGQTFSGTRASSWICRHQSAPESARKSKTCSLHWSFGSLSGNSR